MRRWQRSPQAVETADVLVIGSGVAGLTVALRCGARRVNILTKTELGGGASRRAQGGVAAALGRDDSPDWHAQDTLAVSGELAVPERVQLLAQEGPRSVRELLVLGARFDRNDGGELALGREAGHSRRRIVHARGDATGAEIVRVLVETVRRRPEVRVFEKAFAVDLVRDGDRIVGAVADHEGGTRVLHLARAVVLATGGIGQLYRYTTNPREATGDGLAMAARAGAGLADLELVQFHPTALDAGADPMPLLTEALRGEGAWLIDETETRFLAFLHPAAELAPRDFVARAIWNHRAAGHGVFLDARQALGDEFPKRFPTAFESCRRFGLDPRREPVPVTPAAHYHMGGVAADAGGRTSLPGLWACGEVAATGVHGANRLASNSLLEALVFGTRVAAGVEAALSDADGPPASPERSRFESGRHSRSAGPHEAVVETARLIPSDLPPPCREPEALRSLTLGLRALMSSRVGVVRDEGGLRQALEDVELLSREASGSASEARNLCTVGRLVTWAALLRQESRGGHYRTDFPAPDPKWRRRLRLRLPGPEAAPVWELEEPAQSLGHTVSS